MTLPVPPAAPAMTRFTSPSATCGTCAARAAPPLVAAVALADLLVGGHDVGLGFVLFLAALPLLAALVARPTRTDCVRAAAVTLAALVPLLAQANVLTVLVAISGTFYAALTVQGVLSAGWGARVGEVAVQAVLGPLRLLPIARAGLRLENASGTGAALLRWALPAVLALVFVALFAQANPLIARAVDAIDLSAVFAALFSGRALFWLATAVFAAPFLRAGAPWAGRIAAGLAMMAMLRPIGSDEKRAAASTREAAFAARALLLFNAIFALQTVTDAAYLWGGVALPRGMTYAEYAHRGAYPLLFTAILAVVFVVWATRPRGPAAASPLVARLMLVWVAQNLVLLASSVLRLDLYVEAYALTYWRVAAFIWMGLVAAGFVLVIARALAGRSLSWLVSANVAVLLATLYAVSFPDWADVIARHNLASGRADERYVRSLGPAALPALIAHRRTDRSCDLARTEARLRGRFQAPSWREWARRKGRIAAAVAGPVAPHETCPPPRRRPTVAPMATVEPAGRGE